MHETWSFSQLEVFSFSLSAETSYGHESTLQMTLASVPGGVFMRPILADFIDPRCSVSVPSVPSSLSLQNFVIPASSFLSELSGYMAAGA